MGGSVKLPLSFLGMSLKRLLHPCLEFRCIHGTEGKAVGRCPLRHRGELCPGPHRLHECLWKPEQQWKSSGSTQGVYL